MATGRLTDIIKARRESGKGIASSLAGGFKERLKEKFDIKRALPQGGLLTALFPKLKAYKAQLTNSPSGESAGVGAAPAGGDSLSSSKSLLDSISVSTKIISKNSMALPLIQKNTNLMSQTLKKIVKAMQVKKKFVPITKKTPVLTKSGVSPSSIDEEGDDKKSFFEKLIGLLTSALISISALITKTLIGLSGKIVQGVIYGFKGLFKIATFASGLLLSLLKPLLAIVFSSVGIGLILTAGVAAALYNLYKFAPSRSNLEQRESDINKLKMGYATGDLKTIEPDSVRDLRLSTGLFYGDEKDYLNKKIGEVAPKDIMPNVESTSNTQDLSGTLAVGDDIALGLALTGKIDSAKMDDVAEGRNTSDVLKLIEDNLKEDKNYYQLKHVVLSTGISNSVDMKTGKVNPSAYGDIQKQISKLKEAGAVVTVLGTGPNKAYDGIDEKLKEISELYKTTAVSFKPIASDKDKLINTSGLEFNSDRINPTKEHMEALATELAGKTPKMFTPNMPVAGQTTTPSISPGQMDSDLANSNIHSADKEPPASTAPNQVLSNSARGNVASFIDPNTLINETRVLSDVSRKNNNNQTVMFDNAELEKFLVGELGRMKNTLNNDHPDVLVSWKKQIRTWIGSQEAF